MPNGFSVGKIPSKGGTLMMGLATGTLIKHSEKIIDDAVTELQATPAGERTDAALQLMNTVVDTVSQVLLLVV